MTTEIIQTSVSKTVKSSVASSKTGFGSFDQSGSDPSPSSTLLLPAYKTLMSPRHLVINRTSYGSPFAGGPGSASRTVSIERSARYGALGAAPAGAYAAVTSSGVNNVRQSREKEKRDMQDLNERFAEYIEKVRFLEAQNRRLADELEKLKSKWGKETSQVKAMYQAELDEARRLLDDAEKEKARLEIRGATMEEHMLENKARLDDSERRLQETKEKLEVSNQHLSDVEAELGLLRRRVEGFENDREKDRRTAAGLQDALNRTRLDLDNETLLHIDAENRRQTLEEELEFIKAVHEQEMKELAALAYRDTTAENREYWKSEMGQALREIQEMYDDKLDGMRGEMETFYNLKVQEFRTGATRQNMEAVHAKEESKRTRTQLTDLRDKYNESDSRNAQLSRELEQLRREKDDREREFENENGCLKTDVAKLRAEMEAILRELQDIVDSKLGLELEIAAYRKLLEGEESRIGLRQVVDQWISSGQSERSDSLSFGGGGGSMDSTMRVSQMVKGEISAKTTYQRSAKGPVSIAECSTDGKCVTIENTGRKDEPMGNWRLTRVVDGTEKADYVIKPDFVAKAGSKIRFYALGQKPLTSGSPNDVETSILNWGCGSNVTTKLVNSQSEERATHVQKTLYTS